MDHCDWLQGCTLVNQRIFISLVSQQAITQAYSEKEKEFDGSGNDVE